MMILLVGTFLTCILPFVKCNTLEYDGPSSIRIFHSLEKSKEPHWLDCGVVAFQNVNLGSFNVISPELNEESRSKLLILARNDMLYRLKVIVTTLKGREITYYTFIRACSLLESGLIDTLAVSLDHSGSVIGMTLSASDSCDDLSSYELIHENLNRTVEFKPIEQGPIPDTASYIQKMEREREAKERGATQDNRSFFAKYWMYIVPVVLFAVLSGSTNVDAGNGNSR